MRWPAVRRARINEIDLTIAYSPVRCNVARQRTPALTVDRQTIARFCQQQHIRRLALFGSVLREDFRPTSDVDVLVEFEPGVRMGFIRLAGLEQELSGILGRTVDLRTPADLSRYFRQEVLETSEVLYESP
jgi:predicted nucleotidyltransferase